MYHNNAATNAALVFSAQPILTSIVPSSAAQSNAGAGQGGPRVAPTVAQSALLWNAQPPSSQPTNNMSNHRPDR